MLVSFHIVAVQVGKRPYLPPQKWPEENWKEERKSLES